MRARLTYAIGLGLCTVLAAACDDYSKRPRTEYPDIAGIEVDEGTEEDAMMGDDDGGEDAMSADAEPADAEPGDGDTDAAEPPDMSAAPDLAETADLTVTPDLTPEPDLVPPADQTAFDLAPAPADLACATGLVHCGGTCVDVQTDDANCGQCGTACTTGLRCAAGACAPSCKAPLLACGGACIDVRNDPDHCGACGKACPMTPLRLCAQGACVDPCTGVVCKAMDGCHLAGTCDPATGRCSTPTVKDGTACDDQSRCTRNDACTAGVCGGAAVFATAVAWWAGEGNALDVYAKNNGALRNGAAYAAGKVGQAFDTAAGDVSIPSAPALALPTAMTLEAWIHVRSYTGALQAIIAKNRGSGGTGYAMSIDGTGHLGLGMNNGSTFNYAAATDAVVPTGQWVHVAVTRNLANVAFYINGALSKSFANGPTGSLSTNTMPLVIGSEDTVGGRLFGGLIDEPAVYDVELSAGQIQDIYNAGSLGKCK